MDRSGIGRSAVLHGSGFERLGKQFASHGDFHQPEHPAHYQWRLEKATDGKLHPVGQMVTSQSQVPLAAGLVAAIDQVLNVVGNLVQIFKFQIAALHGVLSLGCAGQICLSTLLRHDCSDGQRSPEIAPSHPGKSFLPE